LIAVFLGYVAVSGLTIHKYATDKGFNGGGIYDENAGRPDEGLGEVSCTHEIEERQD
jgi:hypothetical protein